MKIEPRNINLVITVTPEEQAQLREYRECEPDDFGTSQHEMDFLDNYLASSKYEWVDPMYTGDMTGAPMLGITGEDAPADELPVDRAGEYLTGFSCSGGVSTSRYAPILKRWAYMDYALRSFLTDLADTGEAVFTGTP